MLKRIIGSLVINIVLSWMVLPLLIPPFGCYSPAELIEVFFWQGIALVGWPLALLGGCASFVFGGSMADLGTLFLLLIYPGIWYLCIRLLWARKLSRWEMVALHLLLAFSFAAVWYQVRNGYDFMIG